MKDPAIRKLYYSISEVSKMTGLEQYVLRYWETEFEQLNPSKNRAGNRIYTSKDIKLILFIKKLLREERYTIEGAKQVLQTWNPDDSTIELRPEPAAPSLPDDVKADLREAKALLTDLLDKLTQASDRSRNGENFSSERS
ncbi:MAG TPA: MerR family transcriptional regulator, partial [Candidatus Kapabacteria bacterium]|nr:MerR family transcriptional regulator [Candidatus Kapabacteria bacterium]